MAEGLSLKRGNRQIASGGDMPPSIMTISPRENSNFRHQDIDDDSDSQQNIDDDDGDDDNLFLATEVREV